MASPSDQTHYSVLGLSRDASGQQIKDAYRRAARSTHPDLGGSPELFHMIAEAYETLADPAKRATYDRSIGTTGRPPARASGGRAASGRRAPGPAPTGPGPHTRLPEYVPPFSPGRPPLIPLTLASQQFHGSARQPGLLSRLKSNAGSRYDGEVLTARLLERSLLAGFPAARLVNGLRFDDDARTEAGHAVLAGYRLAVIDSLVAPPGSFLWDGTTLRHRGRTVGHMRIADSVRRIQDLVPECNVRGWLVLHGNSDNPFEPIIDYPPSLDRSALASIHVANPGTVLRELRKFFAEGPQPNVVQLPVLGRLLHAADR